jgi:hypothetical protein
MPRMIRRISAIVYGLGIVGALAFGASEALGRTVSDPCLYKPPALLGYCTTLPDSVQECNTRCNAQGGGPYTGDCVVDNCCECFM